MEMQGATRGVNYEFLFAAITRIAAELPDRKWYGFVEFKQEPLPRPHRESRRIDIYVPR